MRLFMLGMTADLVGRAVDSRSCFRKQVDRAEVLPRKGCFEVALRITPIAARSPPPGPLPLLICKDKQLAARITCRQPTHLRRLPDTMPGAEVRALA